jgi:hypothetical protein
VFARDFGTRNELLRARFGDRTWYRYRAGTSATDTTATFVRLDAPAPATGLTATR